LIGEEVRLESGRILAVVFEPRRAGILLVAVDHE
jgi:hypothetical protein